MARPGGNPDLEKYQFEQKYGWEESCNVTIGLRVPKDWKDRLYALDGWQEKLRGALAQILEESETDSEQAQLHSTPTENAVTTKPAGAAGKRRKTPADRTRGRTQEDETGNASPR